MSKTNARSLLMVILTLVLFAIVTSPLHASMVGTGDLLAMEQAHMDRAQLLQTLTREDMREQMVRMGVNPDAAAERVARMTDEEVSHLNERLSELPAGAGVVEAVVIIFVILVILDAIGVTNIFSFVRPSR